MSGDKNLCNNEFIHELLFHIPCCWLHQRDSDIISVCVCVYVCVCVCVRARARACVRAGERVNVCVCVSVQCRHKQIHVYKHTKTRIALITLLSTCAEKEPEYTRKQLKAMVCQTYCVWMCEGARAIVCVCVCLNVYVCVYV
jgi:hypothetical protein